MRQMRLDIRLEALGLQASSLPHLPYTMTRGPSSYALRGQYRRSICPVINS